MYAGTDPVRRIPPDGIGPEQLTASAGGIRQPAVSGDGKRLAFSTNRDGNFEIALLFPRERADEYRDWVPRRIIPGVH